MKRKIISILKLKLSAIAFSILFLVSLYVLSLRILCFFLEDYRPDIESYLSSLSGQQIKIHRISTAWRGLNPILEVHGLTVNGQQNAYFGRIRLQASFQDSLLNLSPSIHSIVIEHTEINLQQGSDGAWSMAKVPIDLSQIINGQETADGDKLHDVDSARLEVLLGRAQISLIDMSVGLHNKEGLVRSLRIPDSSIYYHDNKVYMSGSVRESEGESVLLSFSLLGTGLLADEPLSTQLYIEARSAEFFGTLLKVYSWERLAIDSFSASTRAWLDFEGFALTSIQGDLQVAEMNWRAGLQSLPPITNLAFNYLWRKDGQGQDLALEGLSYQWAGRQCHSSDLKLTITDSVSDIGLTDLDASCLSQLAVASGLLGDSLHDRLEISQPEGLLKNISLSMRNEHHSNPGFLFEAELDQVSVGAYQGAPSGMGIDGFVLADGAGGYVSFLSDNFELGFPDLYLEPWLMQKSEGYVEWQINGDNVDVMSDGLRLWQQDGSLIYGDFALRLNGPEEEDYLSLALGLQDVQFTNAPSFVPYHIVGSGLHSWLTDALQSGQVSQGVYYGYGSIEGDESVNSFTSSVDLTAQEGVLKFDQDWPPVEKVNGSVDLQNGQLYVASNSALIANTALGPLQATMLEVDEEATSMLHIESSTSAGPDVINYWLSESPIAAHTKQISEQLSFKGLFDVSVALDIPVSDGNDDAELAYVITTTMDNVALNHPDSGIDFTEVSGALVVSSDKGVYGDDIRVTAFNEPALLSISTVFDEHTYKDLASNHEGDGFTDLSKTVLALKGTTSIEQVFEFFGYQTTALIDGNLRYSATLDLPNHDRSFPSVRIESDLQGLSRHWPAPLDKLASSKEDLLTRLLIKPGQLMVLSKLTLADKQELDSELLFVDGKFSFGEVSLNGASMDEPELSGLNIAASLKHIAAEPWISFIDQLTNLPWGEGGSAGNQSLLRKVQLDVEHADAFSQTFKNTRLDIEAPEARWNIALKGNDISGNILLADKAQALKIDLDTLSITSSSGENDTTSSKPKTTVDPREIPGIDFSTKKLLVDGRPFGAWSGLLEKKEDGLTLSGLKGLVGGSEFDGRVNWQALKDGGQHSILTLDAKGQHFENIFRMAGVEPLVSSDTYTASLALTWPASPLDFSPGLISGSMALDLRDGFLQTDDGQTGVLRLFGVLNAEAITRRLKLDFSDLYKSGVGFDTFTTNATFDRGLMTLSKPMTIDGPGGKYVINGVSDLDSKTLDLDMLVELPFAQNVPLAALVLGAPQIGGLVWLADKLLGEPLSALTTSRYDISGTWEAPVVELKEAVNASKKKRSETKGKRPNAATSTPASGGELGEEDDVSND